MAEKKVTHKSLMDNITKLEEQLQAAKDEYKVFCKENPLQAPKQPTIQELRKMREKNDKATLEDHQKANKAAQQAAQKQQLKQEIKGE